MSVEPDSPYTGMTISFGTMHGKHRQVSESFHSILGAHVEAVGGIDTDQFGTFTGDVGRTLDALKTARAKALLGMKMMGATAGLASEGSYGTAPGLFVPGHQEILLFVDNLRGIEVVQGENTVHSLPGPQRVARASDIAGPLARLDWATQALVVRPSAGGEGLITKGIGTRTDLERAIRAAVRDSDDDHAVVEPDLRAHCNLERRRVLRRLGKRLADRLATPCPQCACPGYGRTRRLPGLPCSACGMPTNDIRADLYECPRCPASHHKHQDGIADPMWCDRCNP